MLCAALWASGGPDDPVTPDVERALRARRARGAAAAQRSGAGLAVRPHGQARARGRWATWSPTTGRTRCWQRLSDPFWFQAFGCVLGFDWHSSGVTTTTCGAIKEAVRGLEDDFGFVVAGGKGAASRRTPAEIERACERLGQDPAALVRASRLSAKVDNTAVQDGHQLYHHCFLFTPRGSWCVIQQGMSDATRHRAALSLAGRPGDQLRRGAARRGLRRRQGADPQPGRRGERRGAPGDDRDRRPAARRDPGRARASAAAADARAPSAAGGRRRRPQAAAPDPAQDLRAGARRLRGPARHRRASGRRACAR